MPDALPPAIPAATLVLLRERAGGAPELLMVERAKAMAFAGGALVFPGGRVDPGDRLLAETRGGDADEDAHRIAAIRETIEEAGLPIGLDPLPAPAALAKMRAALHEGAAFGAALAEAGAVLALDRLVPFARWRPAHANMRIFDTRFYLARLPANAPAPSVDRTENTRLLWATAADVLADADAGRATIIYPTRRNLERLALYGSYEEAVADARAHPIRTITPWTEDRDGRPHLCIPTDLGYPVAAEPMSGANRG
jgi:8-oxo-dGTP pyrophosphatase MutT (NUDIX family)